VTGGIACLFFSILTLNGLINRPFYPVLMPELETVPGLAGHMLQKYHTP